MSKIEKSNIKLYPEETLKALERLEVVLAGLSCDIEKPLHFVPEKHALFTGTFAGQNAVFRLPLSEGGHEAAKREWDEINRAWAYMKNPPLTVSKPLHFDPDSGLAVTTLAPGRGLLSYIWNLDENARTHAANLAADWLFAFTAPTLEERKPNRRPWRTRAEAAAAKQPHESLQQIEARVLQKMKKLYQQIDAPAWRVTLAHGDFHLNNLHYDGSTLTGLDLGGTNHAPLYKDIARALVHMARRGMLPSGTRRFGVDATALDHYVKRFELSDLEANGYIPFFICFETLIKVEHPKMPKQRVEHAHAMSEALFADMKQIT